MSAHVTILSLTHARPVHFPNSVLFSPGQGEEGRYAEGFSLMLPVEEWREHGCPDRIYFALSAKRLSVGRAGDVREEPPAPWCDYHGVFVQGCSACKERAERAEVAP